MPAAVTLSAGIVTQRAYLEPARHRTVDVHHSAVVNDHDGSAVGIRVEHGFDVRHLARIAVAPVAQMEAIYGEIADAGVSPDFLVRRGQRAGGHALGGATAPFA